jgi:hypothetical protein
MASRNTHEDFAREEHVEIGSNRTFGVVIGLIAVLFGVYPLVHGDPLRLWLLIPGAALLLVGVLKPGLLAPLNLVWFWIGKLLGMVVAPIVMMMIFFVTITPIALIVRWSGKDSLRLRRRSAVDSYWIKREGPGSTRESLKNQF